MCGEFSLLDVTQLSSEYKIRWMVVLEKGSALTMAENATGSYVSMLPLSGCARSNHSVFLVLGPQLDRGSIPRGKLQAQTRPTCHFGLRKRIQSRHIQANNPFH